MPTFPRYDSKAQLTTQKPSVDAPSSTQPQRTENVAKVAQGVSDASMKWSQYIESAQKNIALANSKVDLAKIESDASLEQDPNKESQYMDELQKSMSKNTQGLSASQAAEVGLEYKIAQIKLGGAFKKKQIAVNNVATQRLVDLEVQNPNENSFPKIQQYVKDNPGLSPEEGYRIMDRANKDLGINRVSRDLYQAQTPEDVDAVTQRLTSGDYEKGGVTIEPDKKKSLLDIAESARKNLEKKIQAQQIEAQAQNRVATIAGVASGEIKLETLNIADISEYDPQLGATLTKAKEFMTNYNPKIPLQEQRVSMGGVLSPSELAKSRSYAKSVQDVFNHNDNQKLGEFMLRELEKKGDGTNQSVKVAAFMQLAALKVKANNPQNPEDLKKSERLKNIKAGVSFIQSSNPYLAPSTIGDFIVKNFLSGASSEKQIMQEARSVLKDKILERYQSVSKLSSLPNKVVDGEASVEDLQSGINELKDGSPSGNYGDQNSGE